MKRKATLFALLTFYTSSLFAQVAYFTTPTLCFEQESNLIIDSISGNDEYLLSLDDSELTSEMKYKISEPGEHKLKILNLRTDLTSVQYFHVEEKPELQFYMEVEDKTCVEDGIINLEFDALNSSQIQIFLNEELQNGHTLYAETGNNTLTIKHADGCSVQKQVKIKNKCLKPYTAITPNGDGLNDTWKIRGIEEFPEARVTIFNLWGQQIFHSQGEYVPWDGSSDFGNVETGNYVYVIQVDGRHDKSNVITGNLSVMR